MKNQIRFFGATLIMAIYCIAVSATMDAPVFPDQAARLDSSIHVDRNHPVVLNTLYNHSSFFESTLHGQNNLPARNFENPFVKLWASARVTENLLKAVFTQYTFIFGYSPLQLRKTDIIFPFHYFW